MLDIQLMSLFDSKIQSVFLVILGALLSSCVSSELSQSDLSADVGRSRSAYVLDNPLVMDFQSLCINGKTYPWEWQETGLKLDWRNATERELEIATLGKLRKSVLAIPGGGARFDEEQILLSKGESDQLVISSLERRFKGNSSLLSSCSVFAQSDHLKTCESIGKLLGRAPDHNKSYPQNKAHFIRWDTFVNTHPATISCDYAPNSKTQAYDGTVLTLQIDHTTKGKTAPKASQQVSGVSER